MLGEHFILLPSVDYYSNYGVLWGAVVETRPEQERMVLYSVNAAWLNNGSKSHKVSLRGVPVSDVPGIRPYVSDLRSLLEKEGDCRGLYRVQEYDPEKVAIGSLLLISQCGSITTSSLGLLGLIEVNRGWLPFWKKSTMELCVDVLGVGQVVAAKIPLKDLLTRKDVGVWHLVQQDHRFLLRDNYK